MKKHFTKIINRLDVLFNVYEHRLYRMGWVVLVVLILLACATAIFRYYGDIENEVKTLAIERAKTTGSLVSIFRQVYSNMLNSADKEIAAKRGHSYDFRENTGLPLPIDLVRELDQKLNNNNQIHISITSPYSSFWGKDSRGLNDNVSLTAWTLFSKQNQTEYLVVEENSDRVKARYLIPDRMVQSCVQCHNQLTKSSDHQLSVAELKVGEVVGVLEVAVEVSKEDKDLSLIHARSNLIQDLVDHFGFILFICIILFFLSFIRNRLQSRLTDLQNWDDRNRSAVNHAPNAMITIDSLGNILDVNPATSQMFGYPESELVGQSLGLLMPPPMDRLYKSYLGTYVKDRKAKIIGKGRELMAKRKDGMLFPIFLSVGEFETNGELFFSGTISDMTELKETQAQLFESARLATFGEMGASVAHELKNSLMGILGPADTAEETLEDKSPDLPLVKTSLKKIIERAKKMQLLVEHIRISSRPAKDEQKEPISINEVIKDALILFMAQLKTLGIQVHLNLSSEEPKTLGVAVRLESIFQNLIANARDAFSEGAEKPDRRIRIATALSFDDREIIITIEDNASGIPPENLKNIFDPFFTTKPKEKGTGLGLAIVSGIIKDHEGIIAVDSTQGVGTRFEIHLPNHYVAREVKAS